MLKFFAAPTIRLLKFPIIFNCGQFHTTTTKKSFKLFKLHDQKKTIMASSSLASTQKPATMTEEEMEVWSKELAALSFQQAIDEYCAKLEESQPVLLHGMKYHEELRKCITGWLSNPSLEMALGNSRFNSAMQTMMDKGNEAMEAAVVSKLNLTPDDFVLEVGFGGATGIEHALKTCRHVFGVDRSEDQIRNATAKFANEISNGSLKVQLGNVSELPYPDDYFDKIYHCNCFYFWPDVPAALKELKRVLKPGGLMIAAGRSERLAKMVQFGCLKNSPFLNVDVPKMVDAIQECGFRDVFSEPVDIDNNKLTLRSFEAIVAKK